MNFERILRKNGKWSKVSGKRGRWAMAKGWAGEIKARSVEYYPTKDGALIAAKYWVED